MHYRRALGFSALILASLALSASSCRAIAGLSDIELVDDMAGGGSGGTGTGTGNGGGGSGGGSGAGQLGEPCGSDGECESGHCADEVCCDSACEGVCSSCLPEDGMSNEPGQCAMFPAGTDPHDECDNADCGGSGMCAPSLEWVNIFASSECEDGGVVSGGIGEAEIIFTLAHDGDIDLGSGTPFAADVPTGFNVAVAAYRGDGTHVSSVGFNLPGDQRIGPVASDAEGNVLVCGHFTGDLDLGGTAPYLSPPSMQPPNNTTNIWVAKLGAADFTPIWAAMITSDGNGDRCTDIAIDPNGGDVVVVGRVGPGAEADGTTPLSLTSHGGNDAVVVRYSGAVGQPIWAATFGGDGEDRARTVAIMDDLGLVFVGGYIGPDSGSQVVIGNDSYELAGERDAFAVVLQGDGVILGSKLYGGYGNDEISHVAIDGTDVLFCGQHSGGLDLGEGPIAADGTDIMVTKGDYLGNTIWVKSFGGPDVALGERCRGLAVRNGEVTIAGLFDTNIDLGGGLLEGHSDQDMFVARLSGDGTHQWSARFVEQATSVEFRALNLFIDPQGNLLLAGENTGIIDFGDGTAHDVRTDGACANPTDAFLAKFVMP